LRFPGEIFRLIRRPWNHVNDRGPTPRGTCGSLIVREIKRTIDSAWRGESSCLQRSKYSAKLSVSGPGPGMVLREDIRHTYEAPRMFRLVPADAFTPYADQLLTGGPMAILCRRLWPGRTPMPHAYKGTPDPALATIRKQEKTHGQAHEMVRAGT